MLEAQGNLWTFSADVHVITTNGFVKNNGRCVMGRGCAQEARDFFPGIDVKLGGLIRVHGNRPFNLGNWTHNGDVFRIATYPVKHRWDQSADEGLILGSAMLLTAMANKFGWERIVMPRPGCGNGKLLWHDVKELLAPRLDDRFTVITWGGPELPAAAGE